MLGYLLHEELVQFQQQIPVDIISLFPHRYAHNFCAIARPQLFLNFHEVLDAFKDTECLVVGSTSKYYTVTKPLTRKCPC
jgi:hypothetical protein